MTSVYAKPHLSVAEQVELLKSRDMLISDMPRAERLLSVVGYYRLSGYWYPYRVIDPVSGVRLDRFVAGTSFDQIAQLYDFDRRLKLLVLDALERIEIAVRFRIGYTLGRRGAYAHLDPSALDGAFTRVRKGARSLYREWYAKMVEAQRRSKEDFVEHFRIKYDGRLPVWVVTEILDFGSLSYLYSGLKRVDRDEVAHGLKVVDSSGRGDGNVLGNWMRVLNYVRNTCAHHSRLWNRNMAVQLSTSHLVGIAQLRHLRAVDTRQTDRLFGTLCVLAYLMDQVSPRHVWTSSIASLASRSLPLCGRTIGEMGFPERWEGLSLWAG